MHVCAQTHAHVHTHTHTSCIKAHCITLHCQSPVAAAQEGLVALKELACFLSLSPKSLHPPQPLPSLSLPPPLIYSRQWAGRQGRKIMWVLTVQMPRIYIAAPRQCSAKGSLNPLISVPQYPRLLTINFSVAFTRLLVGGISLSWLFNRAQHLAWAPCLVSVNQMNGVKRTVSGGWSYWVSQSSVLRLNCDSCPWRLFIKGTWYIEHCFIRKGREKLSEFNLMLEVMRIFWHSW